MSRPLVPLRPLTATHRVLWCVALSIFSAFLMLLWSPAHADDAEAPKAESPYFAVSSSEPGTDRLPLKSTQVDVRIAGVIADVTVTQHYRNEGQRPINARYIFPGSTQAAVYAMQVKLGERVLSARIKEKQQARVEFQAAQREGKTAALLEQHRPNVFQMNVANILPGDDVAVELRYTELLTPRDARYGFVFPTVVGPRYNSPHSEAVAGGGNTGPIGGAYLRSGEASPASFDIRVTLDTPVAVKELASPSHEVQAEGLGATHATVALKPGDKPAHNRDFILHYRLAGERIESGLLLQRGAEGGEHHFLALIEPPKVVAPRQINPRDYIFVVDISGSMHGYPLDTAKVLLKNLIGGLRPSDTFNVMLFSGSSRMLAPASVPATRANIDQAVKALNTTSGGGGTEIVPALRRIAALPKADDVSRSVIVVTDGYVSVEAEVFRLIRQNLQQANVFAFGIGSSVNRHLIEGMARAGQGEAFVVTKPEYAAEQADRLRRIIEAPVLTQVTARFEGLEVYDVEPEQLPDVLGGRPVVVHGKWRGQPGVPASGRLVIEGRTADGQYRQVIDVHEPAGPGPAALRQLWARQRIAALSDQEALEGGSAHKAAITELGLSYNLLTQYTSFIAVDQRVRNPNPALTPQVDQPSPMPEGVSNLAIGAEVPSTPEPGALLALLVVAGIVAATLWSQRRRG